MEGGNFYPPREDHMPPPPMPMGPYGGDPYRQGPPPMFHDQDPRGRFRSDSRDGGFRGGRGRSRSRSPGGGMMHRGGPPPHRPSGEWERYDEPRKEPRRAPAGIEPMDSYKVFMMRQDENSTPETYQQRYEEYKKKYTQRLMRSFFEEHKREEWLQERYSPAIQHRLEAQKRAKKVTEAKNFGDRLRSGAAKICLDETPEPTNADYENDLEQSARILYVRRIPCACPLTLLSETIKKAGGTFQQLYLSDPVKKSAFDFDRSGYIVYETPEAAADALSKVHNTFVQDADTFVPFRLQASQHRSRAPLKTPSYLSVPERLAFDYAQSLKLAQALDNALFKKEADRTRYGIDALLADVAEPYASEKQKLDVIVAYLRRVHHYIYYAGVQCIDMGDIMHAHPAIFCRPEASARDLEEEKARQEAATAAASAATDEESAESKSIGGWAAALDEKVQAYLAELDPAVLAEKVEKQQTLVDEIEAREEAALESTYANYGEKAGDDGKHRCRLCTKLFKAMDFVKKHIRNKHPELVVDKIAEVGESYMWEQYRLDNGRPLPSIETTNTLSNPTLGNGGGRGGLPYQGRGRPGGYNDGPPNRGGYYRDGPPGGYRGRDRSRDAPHRGPYGDRERGPPRSPPRQRSPDRDLPVDPRQITRSYQDLDNLKDTKVELSFDALDGLPPPKKKTKL